MVRAKKVNHFQFYTAIYSELRDQRIRNKDYVIACSQQDKPCAQGSGRHTVLAILDHIDEDILFKVLNRQPIVENHDAGELCTRVISGRQGFRGKAVCRGSNFQINSAQPNLLLI